MGAGSYISSYTGGGKFRSPRFEHGWAGRPRRPWVPRLTLIALLSLCLFSIIGCIVSGLVLGGAVTLPELALAQSFLFSACTLALVYVPIHGIAAFRDLPVYRGQALQHPLHSWAIIVGRIDMVFWVLSLIAVPPSFAKLNKVDTTHIRPGHVDLVVVGFGLISMGIILSIIETCDRPFIIPRVSPEHITCRLSALEINDAVFANESVSRRGSRAAARRTERSTEMTGSTAVEERKERKPSAGSSTTRGQGESVESPSGPRPMPEKQIPAQQAPMTQTPQTTIRQHRGDLPYPLEAHMPPTPEPIYPQQGAGARGGWESAPGERPERPEDWRDQWAEMKADAGFESQGSTPAIAPATSNPSRFHNQPSLVPSGTSRPGHQPIQQIWASQTAQMPAMPPRSRTSSNPRERQGYVASNSGAFPYRQPVKKPSQTFTPYRPGISRTPHHPSPATSRQASRSPLSGPRSSSVSPPPAKNPGRAVFDQAARQLRDQSLNVQSGGPRNVSPRGASASGSSGGDGQGQNHQTKPAPKKKPESQTTNDLHIPGSW